MLNLILSINFPVGIVKNATSTRISEHVSGLANPTEMSKHPHAAVSENFEMLQRTKATKTAEEIALKQLRRKQDILNGVAGYILFTQASAVPVSNAH